MNLTTLMEMKTDSLTGQGVDNVPFEPKTYENVAKGCQYSMFILAVIGTITNSLSIATLCSKNLRHQATSVGLIMLALSDILVLVTCIFRYHVYYIFLDDDGYLNAIFTIDAYFEVYVEPLYWMSLGMSSMIIVAITTQRFVAIRYPFFTKKYVSLCASTTFIVIMIIIPIGMTLPHFFYYEVLKLDYQGTTVHITSITQYGKNDPYRCIYLQYLLPIMFYILPWIYLAVANFLLVHHVRLSSRVSHASSMTTQRGSHRHSRNLTLLLILVVSVYMILNLPKCILVFMRLIDNSEACNAGSDGTVELPTNAMEVANWIVTVLNISNSAVNFLLYYLFGERFRKEFIRMFLACRCSRHILIHIQTSIKTSTVSEGQSVM